MGAGLTENRAYLANGSRSEGGRVRERGGGSPLQKKTKKKTNSFESLSADSLENQVQSHDDVPHQGPLQGVPAPARCHQLPAVRVEPGQPLWSQPLAHGRPELFLVAAGIKRPWEFGVVGADVPEEDSEGVDVDGIVVQPTEEFGGHVDGGSHDGACHHGLRLAEAQIRQAAPVAAVQLDVNTVKGQHGKGSTQA